MNISESLSELKLMKSRISRLQEVRKETIKYKKGKKPTKDFKKLTNELNALYNKSSDLKAVIQYTNNTTEVDSEGVTIQQLILEQGDIRSEISALKDMLGSNRRGYNSSGVFDSYDDKDTMYQITRFDIEDSIVKLEKDKRKLDSLIQQANWRTKIEE